MQQTHFRYDDTLLGPLKIRSIQHGKAWKKHINLQGEFDFSDEALIGALQFDLEALLTVEWEAAESNPAANSNATIGPNF
ncbi:hypothetical protein [uncultured Hymenobacter sp.]|uniref:hypothetical protein n=1 Tax=uncultured Hymenobacter sp. TaxID=170016 RepID=UPI0035C9CC45